MRILFLLLIIPVLKVNCADGSDRTEGKENGNQSQGVSHSQELASSSITPTSSSTVNSASPVVTAQSSGNGGQQGLEIPKSPVTGVNGSSDDSQEQEEEESKNEKTVSEETTTQERVDAGPEAEKRVQGDKEQQTIELQSQQQVQQETAAGGSSTQTSSSVPKTEPSSSSSSVSPSRSVDAPSPGVTTSQPTTPTNSVAGSSPTQAQVQPPTGPNVAVSTAVTGTGSTQVQEVKQESSRIGRDATGASGTSQTGGAQTQTTQSGTGPITSTIALTPGNSATATKQKPIEDPMAREILHKLGTDEQLRIRHIEDSNRQDAQAVREYLFHSLDSLIQNLNHIKNELNLDRNEIVKELASKGWSYRESGLRLLNYVRFDKETEIEELLTGYGTFYDAMTMRIADMNGTDNPMELMNIIGSLPVVPRAVAMKLEQTHAKAKNQDLPYLKQKDKPNNYAAVGYRIGLITTYTLLGIIDKTYANLGRLEGYRYDPAIVTVARLHLRNLQRPTNLTGAGISRPESQGAAQDLRDIREYMEQESARVTAATSGTGPEQVRPPGEEKASPLQESIFKSIMRELGMTHLDDYIGTGDKQSEVTQPAGPTGTAPGKQGIVTRVRNKIAKIIASDFRVDSVVLAVSSFTLCLAL